MYNKIWSFLGSFLYLLPLPLHLSLSVLSQQSFFVLPIMTFNIFLLSPSSASLPPFLSFSFQQCNIMQSYLHVKLCYEISFSTTFASTPARHTLKCLSAQCILFLLAFYITMET